MTSTFYCYDFLKFKYRYGIQTFGIQQPTQFAAKLPFVKSKTTPDDGPHHKQPNQIWSTKAEAFEQEPYSYSLQPPILDLLDKTSQGKQFQDDPVQTYNRNQETNG